MNLYGLMMKIIYIKYMQGTHIFQNLYILCIATRFEEWTQFLSIIFKIFHIQIHNYISNFNLDYTFVWVFKTPKQDK